MDPISKTLKEYYSKTFSAYGATARGVDWGNETELIVRYDKMIAVLNKDFMDINKHCSLLDVGCGWGGLLKRINEIGLPVNYTGADIVPEMIHYAKSAFQESEFLIKDIFEIKGTGNYDFVVCNAILTQKLNISKEKMDDYSKKLIVKMFDLCKHGVAFNMMSTKVNFMVENLHYQEPSELLSWLLRDVSPRVRLDHGYSSLRSGRGKYYDFTVYVYKD